MCEPVGIKALAVYLSRAMMTPLLQDSDHSLVAIDCSTLEGQALARQLLEGWEAPTAAAVTGTASQDGQDRRPLAAVAAAFGYMGLAAALDGGTLVLDNLHMVCGVH